MGILDDPDREFASSIFVRLEVLPKAVYHSNQAEVEFYEAFFSAVADWASPVEPVVEDAYRLASQYGLAAMDALHLAAAIATGSAELVTTEKREKPLFRTSAVKVTSLW